MSIHKRKAKARFPSRSESQRASAAPVNPAREMLTQTHPICAGVNPNLVRSPETIRRIAVERPAPGTRAYAKVPTAVINAINPTAASARNQGYGQAPKGQRE